MRYCVAFAVLLLWSACKNSPTDSSTKLPSYVLSHTTGTIGRDATITITLDTVYAEEAIDFFLTPGVAGSGKVTDRYFVFTPDVPLPSGQTFRATVSLDGRSPYTFDFSTPPRELELQADGYYIRDPAQPARVELTGRLLTNDGASLEEMQGVLQASYRDAPLEVSLQQQSQNVFTYVATVPDRGTEPGTAVIQYDGGGAFAGATGRVEVPIAPVGTFEVIDVAAAAEGEGIVMRFTDPVATDQDLTGLLRFRPRVDFTTSVSGNLLTLYPTATELPEATLVVDPQLASVAGKTLERPTEWLVNLGKREPALRAVSNGTIMPHDGRRLYTFEAIGLDRVYFELFRIQTGNVLHFLQEQSLGEVSAEWNLRRVGTVIDREEIDLTTLAPGANRRQWTRYAIDLGDYIGTDDASLYQVRLAFGLEYTEQACRGSLAQYGLQPIAAQLAAQSDFQLGFTTTASLLASYSGIYDYYDWEQRDDPCSPAYYNRERFLLQNVLSSNLGLIAKRNPDRTTLIFTTNLLEAGPQGGVGVKAYSYAGEELASGSTDTEGMLRLTTEQEPAFLVAILKQETAYLRLQEEDALPVGRFDVAGTEAAGGLRGSFFAERGVWRPGDSVFLYFVLEDRESVLPADYPITFTLTDARGRVVDQRSVSAANDHGMYALAFHTDAEDATGNWSAEVQAAGQTYRRTLAIETVKPNRLAIELTNGSRTTDPLQLRADWLYGAPAAGLRAEVMVRVQPRDVEFPGLLGYAFQDPARSIESGPEKQLFEGRLDARGKATVPPPAQEGDQLPGPLQLRLSTKVYEPGGNFSIDNVALPYDAYRTYAGVRLPEDDWGNKTITTSGTSTVDLAAVSTDGRGVANRRLSVGIYRVDWRYWWQDGNDNVARFSSSAHTESIATYAATTDAGGRATVSLSVPDWGRYLLRVCDADGHCAGDYFYGGSSAAAQDDRQAASLLRLQAEKKTVGLGERINLGVPTSAGGNLLVSLEKGAGSLEQFWVPTTAGQTQVTFAATEQMIPTVYTNVTYLQPYAQTTNDRPVRLFGVVPVEVQSAQSLLHPQIITAPEWKPRETVKVTVREQDNRPMTYVLAVVDEGLLGLTRFTTPDLHADFFSKEALSVKTYDVYDQVMSSINGEFGKVLAIGGDGEIVTPEESGANRFPPVVRHLGPFTLEGGEATHRIELPNYLGAVRVMVVAAGERAYGSAEQRVTVSQPLMVLPTLPRVIGPEETVDLPVSVINTTDGNRRVSVSVKDAAGLVNVTRADTTLNFTASGDRLTYFPVTVGQRTGVARFEVSASGGNDRSSQEVEVGIRQPNLPTTRSTTVGLAPGQTQEISYSPFGLPGSRSATLELSGLPAMNLQRHLDYLLQYPYGCVEQTISAAFAQLYVDRVMELSTEETDRRQQGISGAITALRRFQTGGGALGYWPGDQQPHPWATNYGLHFLLEAERAGFAVSYDLKQQLLRFQQSAAGSWTRNDGAFYSSLRQRSLDQAYRLYTLALAGQADIGAMNRLRGLRSELESTATYQLAAAYALAGRQDVAAELVQGESDRVKPYRELGYTFGSDLRDIAIILIAELAMDETRAAAAQALRLAEQIGKRSWLSTQEAAFAFVALGQLGDQSGTQVRADFTSPTGATSTVGTSAGVYDIALPTGGEARFTVKNTGNATLYVVTSTTGVPRAGEETATSNRLDLRVNYRDLNGDPIDVSALTSGTEFVASYTVSNPGSTGQTYQQLALRSVLPSGWEVAASRLAGTEPEQSDPYEYQDIRDDRVYTFFDLPAGSSKTFSLRLTATYPGRYYLPTQVSEAMYDHDIRAQTPGQWVTVSRSR
ncbi:alpha-2-macroglobulin family protein [Neolewinella sp.]|uniref:alpha-2-macroglobulin family protein n=1 Tax=Neolewinella sp. TaxID=2993543 RepID=UPI003B526AC9